MVLKNEVIMLKSLVNIQSAFSHTRLFLILLVSSNLIILGCVAFFAFNFKVKQEQKIYALQGEQSLMFALNQNTSDNREAEANATIRDFHELFFNILPDAKEIEYRMQRALAMSDNSVYSVYKNLKDNRYYEQITDAGIFCQFKCDSINIDFTRYPYHCSMWGKTSIVRTSSTTFRNVETTCQLRNCARTNASPHGFLIENWEVVDNSELNGINSLY